MVDTNNLSTCSCKVGRKIDQYKLEDLNSELIRQRRKDDSSLRKLADYINKQILTASLEKAEVNVADAVYGAVSGEDIINVIYDALAGDDTPTERVARVRTRLNQQGIDIETVENDWVTHPTVRTHLLDCLDVDTSRPPEINTDDARDTVEWARTRCTDIIDQTFKRLRSVDILITGPLDITVTIQITCTACGSTYRPHQLLKHRECDCTSTDNSE